MPAPEFPQYSRPTIWDRERFGSGLLLVIGSIVGVAMTWPVSLEGVVLAGIFALAGVMLIIKARQK